MSKQNGDCHSSDIQPSGIQPEQLTAYALGQLHGDEAAAVKAALGEGHSATDTEVREVQTLAAAISSARNAEPLPKPSAELRNAIEQRLNAAGTSELKTPQVELPAERRPWNRRWTFGLVVAGGLCCVLVALLLPAIQASRDAARRTQAANNLKQLPADFQQSRTVVSGAVSAQHAAKETHDPEDQSVTFPTTPSDSIGDDATYMVRPRIVADHDEAPAGEATILSASAGPAIANGSDPSSAGPAIGAGGMSGGAQPTENFQRFGNGREWRSLGSGGVGGGSPQAGGYGAAGMPGQGQASGYSGAGGYPGAPGGDYGASIASNPGFKRPAAATEAREYYYQRDGEVAAAEQSVRLSKAKHDGYALESGRLFAYGDLASAGEQYESIVENAFLSPLSAPLSTFSIDVDTASYANVRRFLNEGRLPPPSAVRIEELVNYFTYSYPQPKGKEPFSANMEVAECPWNAGHLLLRVGLKGKEVHRSERPASNLTFLLDVSGSMSDANKLPLLKTTLMMFVAELTENDRVSIVTYAGDAGLRLPPTRGNEKEKIMAAIDSLSAGGSTHGSAGIQLAYEQAGQYFLNNGTNRVILATDGDLNVGVTSDDALVELIKEKAAGGTFLTVLGFGTGNLKDGKLEKLADNGNGVYAYIDGVREGRKVLVEQMSGSLVTIAKDVKIQIEFNPAQIASYRLLGYENRVLAAEDFNNDKKDAGEIGAGHTVTALYELVPVGMKEQPVAAPAGEPLRYQASGASGKRELPDGVKFTEASATGELLTLKLRYKEPDGVESRLVEFPLKERGGQFHSASKDLQFAAAVASFGMILRGSEHRGSGSLPAVAEIAGGAIDYDPNGYRAEFIDLIRKAQALGAK